jgi:phage baseplate assembly protein W
VATDIIGQGWAFPIKPNAKGGLSWSSGPDRIEDAIWIVLGTSLGERIMRPNFGAGANDYVFQPNSAVMRTRLASDIREALTKWEPRIDLVAVAVNEGSEPNQVLASIDYKIRTTNEIFNLVYPLYLQEGAG